MLLLGVVVFAQSNSCPVFVEQALIAVEDNCDEMPRNHVCYGYQRVDAAFTAEISEDTFTEPADLAELTQVRSIRTFPYTPLGEQWGIAVMTVQANVPNSLPGQAVTFMLLGTGEIENRVQPDAAFSPVDGVSINPLPDTNFRSGPGTDFNVVGNSGDGVELIADGVNPAVDWVRALFNEQPIWVFRDLLTDAQNTQNLPVIDEDTRTPMQAFYFTGGVGQPLCNEAPDALVIQSAPTMEVTLDANGLTMQAGSTGVLYYLREGILQTSVFEGSWEINGVVIPAGFTISHRVQADGTLIEQSAFGFRELTQDEIDQYFWMETYDTTFFRPLGQIQRPQIIQQPAVTPGVPVTIVGDCAGFRRTSPVLPTIPTAPVDFFWDPPNIPGVTRYEIIFYNENNQRVESFAVDAPFTTIRLDTGLLATGSVLRWDVIAYVGDDSVCATGPSEFQVKEFNIAPEDIPLLSRDDDDDDGGGGAFPATAACHNPGIDDTVEVDYAGVTPGETLTFAYSCSISGANSVNHIDPGAGSGDFVVACDGLFTGGTVTSPSKGNVNIGGFTIECEP